MFEEEAKKHKEEFITTYINVGGGLNAADMIGMQKEQSYQEGAEFGYNKTNERLLKAKELLTRWVELFKPKGGNIPPTPIQVETEQFLKEE